MNAWDRITTDVLVVGAGVAGLRAAIAAAEACDVLVLVKDRLRDSNTQYAQGGIAVALSDEDRVRFHYRDTLAAGAGLTDAKMARILVEEGVRRVEELLQWGAEFDRDGGRLIFGLEGAHTRRRVLHAGGDSTGREIVRTLMDKANRSSRIRFIERAFTLDLVLHDGQCIGTWVMVDDEKPVLITARGVILATGGSGRIYRYTTNPPFATADGIGIAIRAGAVMMDMEFFQFHPTALNLPDAPNFLLSEALRGEGAHLIDETGRRFMFDLDDRGELASRDIVARGIVEWIRKGHRVFLDLRPIGEEKMQHRFPRILQVLKQFGLDPFHELVPIIPAAHYYMGGIRTDADGRTSIPGLYAAGEVACNGVHGANRLASNSLLDGLVFGARAGRAVIMDNRPRPPANISTESGRYERFNPTPPVGARLPEWMWEYAGVIRHGEGLKTLLTLLTEEIRRTPPHVIDRRDRERLNGLLCGWMLAAFAWLRTESRGAHYREDYPREDPALTVHHQDNLMALVQRLQDVVDGEPLLAQLQGSHGG